MYDYQPFSGQRLLSKGKKKNQGFTLYSCCIFHLHCFIKRYLVTKSDFKFSNTSLLSQQHLQIPEKYKYVTRQEYAHSYFIMLSMGHAGETFAQVDPLQSFHCCPHSKRTVTHRMALQVQERP